MNAALLNRAILPLIAVQCAGLYALLKTDVKSLENTNNVSFVYEADVWLYLGRIGGIMTLVGLVALAFILWWRGRSLDLDPAGRSAEAAGGNRDISHAGHITLTQARNAQRLSHILLLLICSQGLALYPLLMADLDNLRGTSDAAVFQETDKWLFYARAIGIVSLLGLVGTAVIFRWKGKSRESRRSF